jgi:hypothetical protein
MKTLTIRDRLVLERLFREAVDAQIQVRRICSNIEAVLGHEVDLIDDIEHVAAGVDAGRQITSPMIEDLIKEWQDMEDPDDQ